ncbi:MAG: hypothetical protein SGJ18_02665 [Pseudomonadota bacterium]|nr:hypothetical protein [Pseudomonadota bacterium]
MSRHRLWHFEPKLVRDTLHHVFQCAKQIHEIELELIRQLSQIDENRYFVRLGYKSLRTFCVHDLKFTRTQAQRIVTEVRRHRTTFEIEQQG